MKFWTLADVDQHSKQLIKDAGSGEIQVIGQKDRLPIVIITFDKLFEPDRTKWVDFQINISDNVYENMVRITEEKDIDFDDLFVLLAFDFITSRRLDAYRKNNDLNIPKNEV